MPFKKTDSQGSQPSTDSRNLFIGRTGELLFFVENILKPQEPIHNIISIWGQGGVGKSTLLSRLLDEARSADFKDFCRTATVDNLQTTPTSIMEQFADQLQIVNANPSVSHSLIHITGHLLTPLVCCRSRSTSDVSDLYNPIASGSIFR
jgi:Cdc6-like AAA superfamily ATPase